MKKFTSRAFSLIEISIVIVIIGILIAGITQGSRLVKASNLSSAQNLTRSSNVAAIKDLALWLETTLDDAFADANDVAKQDLEDGAFVARWNDINPQLSVKKNGVQTTADANRPTYVEDGINGLPTLRFDDAADYFDTPTTVDPLADDFTIFAVVKFLAGATAEETIISYPNFRIKNNGNGGNLATWADNGTSAVTVDGVAPGRGVSMIVSLRFKSGGIFLGVNGVESAQQSGYNFDIADNNYRIGINSGLIQDFGGDISEIIMYSRSLTTDERGDVLGYLSKKWKIELD